MLKFRDSPKRAINLSLNAQVLETAKGLGMNISQTVDELLTQEVLRRYHERWREENREGIAAYNQRIEREGSFAQRIRRSMEAAEAPSAPVATGKR